MGITVGINRRNNVNDNDHIRIRIRIRFLPQRQPRPLNDTPWAMLNMQPCIHDGLVVSYAVRLILNPDLILILYIKSRTEVETHKCK